MCGISGIAGHGAARPVTRELLHAMRRTLCHRGPDAAGLYLRDNVGLAIRRLSVIEVAGGRQPAHSEDDTVHAVVNGEIYNYQALRRWLARRGHRFGSAGDCAVVPHLYEEYGVDFPKYLEGMFAIALWDERRRQLLLCRDRVGIKPMYYAVQAGRLVFGSEIRAILAAGVHTTLDPQALSDYLSLMYIPGPRSIYSEIRKLEPATTLVWRDGAGTKRRYWQLAGLPQRRDLTGAQAGQKLRRLLVRSVEQQLMADVPVGFFLSGGMDSSTIVAVARQLRPDAPLRTFSVGFEDRSYDERREAALVARRFQTEHTELVVQPRAQDVVDRIAPSFDEPFADPSAVPTYYLCQLARRRVAVALSGDGGDEVFAGYATYQADKLARYYRRLPRPLTAGLAPALVRFMPASRRRTSLDFRARRFVENALQDPARSHYLWRVVFREAHKAALLDPGLFAEVGDAYDTHEPHDRAGAGFDPLTRSQYTDANVYLAEDVLAKADRVSMAHSLEVRVPLLATPLVEFAFSLPGSVKMPRYQPKRLLRRAMASVLPPETVTMPKKGFNAPVSGWLAGPFRPLLDEYLSRRVLRRQGFFQPEAVQRLISRHLAGTAEYGRELWILLMFTLWAERRGVP